jgi:hypothetical protein
MSKYFQNLILESSQSMQLDSRNAFDTYNDIKPYIINTNALSRDITDIVRKYDVVGVIGSTQIGGTVSEAEFVVKFANWNNSSQSYGVSEKSSIQSDIKKLDGYISSRDIDSSDGYLYDDKDEIFIAVFDLWNDKQSNIINEMLKNNDINYIRLLDNYDYMLEDIVKSSKKIVTKVTKTVIEFTVENYKPVFEWKKSNECRIGGATFKLKIDDISKNVELSKTIIKKYESFDEIRKTF